MTTTKMIREQEEQITVLLKAWSTLSGRVMDIASSLSKDDPIRKHLLNACQASREIMYDKERKGD